MDAKSQGDHANRAAGNMKQDLHNLGEHARQGVNELGEAARQQTQVWEQGLEARIREKPLESVLIAAGIGLLVGVLWRR